MTTIIPLFQVVLGIVFFPSIMFLEFKSKEELQLMPQTVEEHIQDLEDSDSDSSTDSSDSDDDADRHSIAVGLAMHSRRVYYHFNIISWCRPSRYCAVKMVLYGGIELSVYFSPWFY